MTANPQRGPAPRHGSGLFASTIALLTLVAGLAVIVPPDAPAKAVPCRSPGSPFPSATATGPAPTTEPTGSRTTGPEPTTDPADAPTTGDATSPSPAPATVVSRVPATSMASADPVSTPAGASPTPDTGTPAPTATRGACPSGNSPRRPAKGRVPAIAAEPGQPLVTKVPSRLTGSRATMYGLRLAGVVELPTADGTIVALRFTMDKWVTPDFTLRVPARGDHTLPIKSSELTVEGGISLYATRFAGTIDGTRITLTPESPTPPDGVELDPSTAVLDDPEIQLVYLHSDRMAAPRLAESVS